MTSNEKRSESLKKSWKLRDDYHGMYNTPIYTVWRSMTTRCRGTAGPDSIRKYLNKGITVCDRWLSFKGFYEDMADGHQDGLTIDRVDNSKGYFKENCRWATYREQANNKSTTLLIEFNGKTQTFRAWSDELGIPFGKLRCRYYQGYKTGKWTLSKVFEP